VASDSAHYYVLITPAGFETFFQATGTVLDQPFEGELPVPGPVPPERVGELQAVLTSNDQNLWMALGLVT
jgi:hypothetical protein